MEMSSVGKLLNKKADNQNKPKFSLIQYLKESKLELKKVAWPSKQYTWKQTLVVILISFGVAIFLGFWDYLFNFALEWYLKV